MKASRNLLLIYLATFLILSYFYNTKNECSKQVKACFFSLSSYFSNMKNMCSKQAVGYFLVYSSLISIVRLMFCHEKCVLLIPYYRNFRKLLWKDTFSFLKQITRYFGERLLFSLFIDFYKHFLSNDKKQATGYSVLLCMFKVSEMLLLIHQVNKSIYLKDRIFISVGGLVVMALSLYIKSWLLKSAQTCFL